MTAANLMLIISDLVVLKVNELLVIEQQSLVKAF